MHGISNEAFFDTFDFDAIHWTSPFKANTTQHQQWQGLTSTDGTKIFDTPDWQVTVEDVTGWGYVTRRWFFTTPRGQLTMETQSNEHTTWISEHLLKEKGDLDIIAPYIPQPVCDVTAVNAAVETYGDRGIVRGTLCGFDVYGQAGCWTPVTGCWVLHLHFCAGLELMLGVALCLGYLWTAWLT